MSAGATRVPVRPDWRVLSASAGLDEHELRTACRRRRFARGETVFHEGDPGGSLHLIDIGRVTIRLVTPQGEVAIVDVLQAGDVFGEQALVDDWGERTATVVAMEHVETLALDGRAFDALRSTSVAFDRFLLAVLSGRLRFTSQQLLEARFLPADERVHRCLVRLLDIFDGGADPVHAVGHRLDVRSDPVDGQPRPAAGGDRRDRQRARGRIVVDDRSVLLRRAHLHHG